MPVRGRIHAGEEGVAAGSAALLGVIVHELGAFIADAIDVGRLADHQPLMVDARLHPADVVAHDEEDVGLLAPAVVLPPACWPVRTARHQIDRAEQRGAGPLKPTNGVRGGVAIKGGLSGNIELNMATLSCL